MELINTHKDFFNNDYLKKFYTIERHSNNMTDGGGPFGFDIQKSIEFNLLIIENNIDIIVETGTHCGDTTEFLAKIYPDKKIITCETNITFFNVSKLRLKEFKNVEVFNVSSDYLINNLNYNKNIIFYLDAHWEKYWPIENELKNIKKGIIAIDDFFIDCANYGFDHYDGKILSKQILIDNGIVDNIYSNNPFSSPLFPIMQNKRIAGRAYTTKNINTTTFNKYNFFKKI
jgi:hypothetical protein